jgi:hypothetical protein
MEQRKYLPTIAELIDRLSISQLKEVKLVEDPVVANGVKPAAKKTKPKQVKSEPAKIVQLVQPLPTKKKGRPKKDTTV